MPHNLAGRFGERFFVRSRLEKGRNPVCHLQRLRDISNFSNRGIAEKIR